MLNLFSFRYENIFRLYALLFTAVVFANRYIFPASFACEGKPDICFYVGNPLRIVLLMVPFLYFSLFYKTEWAPELLPSNIPFLFLAGSAIALPEAQLLYFLIFAVSCVFVRGLRQLSVAMVLLSVIWIGITLPGFVTSYDRAKISSVKANMHTLQTLLEIYAIDWHKTYPLDVAKLEAIAKAENYWREIKNPVTQKQGVGLSFADTSPQELAKLYARPERNKTQKHHKNMDILGVRLRPYIPNYKKVGQVLFLRTGSNSYLLYGVDVNDDRLILERGTAFVLSNAS